MQTEKFYGFSIQYPDDWEIVKQEEATDDTELTLMIQSPETSFWMLKLFNDSPSPEEVLTTAADAICEEYDNVDVYSVDVEINGEEQPGMDLEFVCFDLLCAASLRAFPVETMTVLVYSQWADQEKEFVQEPLDAITGSLEYHNESS
ncbi:hypothetical protein MNBD_PLANCTO02-3219 [hydrothermal vent metagenome]|uniref:Uncharacterized protein n=1 Tax=hydrothermal vent metagenome TaxID=652676 RepID=A0A3B1DY45_9ZZZZ